MSLRIVRRITVVAGKTPDGRDPVRAARSQADGQPLLVDYRGLATGHTAAALKSAGAIAAVVPAGIAVAGAFRQVSELQALLARGQDRVFLGDAALTDPSLLDFCVQQFGSQRIGAQVAWRLGLTADPEVFAGEGRSPTGREVVAWCRQVAQRGAGEILLQDAADPGEVEAWSALIHAVAAAVKVPIVAACPVPHADLLAAGAAGVVVDV
jgi:cyclase